jgi:L-cysteine desulfidase
MGKMMDQNMYQQYVNILKEELVPAMGCTEPIAVAYAAALARKTLGEIPEIADVIVSGNIIKNVKSVIVPNTGGMHGLEAAASAGIAAGDADRELEVLAGVTEEEIPAIRDYLESHEINVQRANTDRVFEIDLRVYKGENSARVLICDRHTNVVRIEKNGKPVFEKECGEDAEGQKKTDRSVLNIEDIIEFAETADLNDVEETLQRQIDYNTAIAREGLGNPYGARIGQVLLASYGDSVQNQAKAWAAAGSDARMGGCDLPVVINSGSGNQGITISLPIIKYAEYLKADHEHLLRALIIGNLTAIHLKTGIGCLSAYCGATSAGAGAAAGITYLYGGGMKEISHTIVNTLAINSGVVCDGAKASCAAKIASAIEAGLLGMNMYKQGSEFYSGDGIVTKGVENTIDNIGELARDGMADTDKEIIHIMLKKRA